ncbi:Molybdopterin-guanine dinucleotide biosynthesis protein B [Desulfosarcina cetonica]|uniref:molybdopterin-guanine dinucleotide biosynthesis protein B n=1 Tax=Desulfosarcina cetonica TaxID=90730 RepID=UPI0006D0F590|nr:molybdopterin-guanine dinucleotide biosynthesis protein B [Desulfosarcina cetonica]VTR70405.1 Molybdopterin-guanine dinucleotide biosynthesis protein B [Desulfosarcina cetonica]
MTPPILSIVSKKNSGKTTLLEKLIPALLKNGYRVGTVKHDSHGFEIDHEGKDTWRHKRAGALTVAISSPWKLSLIKDVKEELSLDEIVDTYFDDMDLVLTEGYKRSGKPSIEVFRSTAHQTPLHVKGASNNLLAVVSDVPVDLGVPNFGMNDIDAIMNFILTRFPVSHKNKNL